MADWFYVEAGSAIGPLSRIELEAGVRSGRITPDTLVCEDGQSEWRLARKVPGLVPPRVMKAWQASVAAASRASDLADRRTAERAAAPVVKSPAPAPSARAPAPGKGPALRDASLPEQRAHDTGAPSVLRRHAGLAVLIACAAVGGGGLGALLVMRLMEKNATLAQDQVAPPRLARDPPPAETDPGARPSGLRPPVPSGPAPLPADAVALVQSRQAGLRARIANHVRESETFVDSGGLDASTLGSREAIAARLDALAALRESNEELRRSLSSLPDEVRRAAESSGMTPEVADAASRRVKADLATESRDREADARMHDLAAETLALLEATIGHWRIRMPGKALEFLPEAGADAPERYARLVEDAARLSEPN